MHYLDDTDVVLCHTCARDKRKLLFSVRNADRCFLSEGFSNWKKAIEKFREHQESKCHPAATESMTELPKKCRDAAEIHSDKLTEQKQLNRRIATNVLREIVDQIKQAGFYSLLADECTDIANKEQLTICLRWIDDKLQSNEEFLEFYEIPNTNAETIATVIEDALFRIGLPLKSCRGQCYDGAGPVAGIKNGLGVIIQ